MQQIKCPKCGEVFQVDESGYQHIAKQIRDQEFQKELAQRITELSSQKDKDMDLRLMQLQMEADEAAAKKDQEILRLKAEAEGYAMDLKRQEADLQRDLEQQQAQSEAEKERALLEKNAQIARLTEQLKGSTVEKQLAVTEAIQLQQQTLSDREAEITALKMELERQESERQKDLAQQQTQSEAEKERALLEKDAQIARLTEQLKTSDLEKQLAVTEAVQQQKQILSDKESKILSLESELKNKETENKLSEKSLSERFAEQLRQKEEQIEYYKDLKLRQSTKMVGENLEQHCETQFNQLRMAAFPRAYFEKDNDARHGSKGDYIFRESDEDGTEFISIMFEMKNEMDETATKHKNEDFFAKLDKDRREKKCEYAVLVSLLERNNEYYNDGIVDVSYRYEKMYVIRPQFFIPLITLLRNAARNSLKYRKELAVVRNQQIDIQNFEANMADFKDKFGRNFRIASEKFQTAIDEIDKTIDHLQKTKAALLSSENNLRLANDKAENLSIKRLTKNAPMVKAMFDAQRNGETIED